MLPITSYLNDLKCSMKNRKFSNRSCEIGGDGSRMPDPHLNCPAFIWNRCKSFAFLVPSEVVAAEKMKNLFLFGALGGVAILHFAASAETVKPDVSATSRPTVSAPVKTNGEKKTEEDCEAESRANQEAMIRYNMTEESYVEQCSVADDVPPIPESKMNAAPSTQPK